MRPARRRLAVLLILLAGSVPAGARPKVDRLPPSTRLVLDNGLEVVLIPNRTAPLITSVAVVRAGSSLEDPSTSGISHMLEHLLFSGTRRRSHQDIAAAPGLHGLVNNAHTDVEHTAYFVLAAREQFAEALDLQADMLLNATIPEDRLVQEREIIANEIAKDRVQDEAALSELYAARLYTGGLSLPVIGTPESVRAIPRDAILDYYRTWYAPNNMTLIVMGDFEPAEMTQLVRNLFGAAAPRLLPEAPDRPQLLDTAALGRAHTVRTQGARRLWIGAPAPGIGNASFVTARMLAELLGTGLLTAVNARLEAARPGGGALLDATVGLEARARAGSLQVRAVLDGSVTWADASASLRDEILSRLRRPGWKSRDLDQVRLEEKAALIRLWEKPHYFGLDRAPYVAGGGWELARDLVRHMDWVEPADLEDLAGPLAAPELWATFMAGPDAPPDNGPAAGAAPAGRAPAIEGRPSRESRALVDGWKPPAAEAQAPPAPLAPVGGDGARRMPPVRTSLPNGMRMILESSDDSRVFAAHVLVRDRALAEPSGRGGIAEVLHSMIGMGGTKSHPGERLQEALRAVGGTLKTSDDPSIPYDDIYLTPEYSYIRLEALDEHAPEALDLLREILFEPVLDSEASFVMARDQQMARVRRAAASPRDRARLAVAGGLWGKDHPAAASPFGTEASLAAMSLEDIRAFHAAYFSPRNLIVAIGTSVPLETLLPRLEARLGRWGEGAPARPNRVWPPPAPAAGASREDLPGPREVAEALDASQAYVAWGRLTTPETAPTLAALASVLGARMGLTLRETRGLSYSLGADASPLGGMVQWTAGMGILPDKVAEARAGVREMILSLASSPPEQPELDAAARDARVRSLMRGLSRINRAWQRCVDELRQEGRRPAGRPGDPSGPADSSGSVQAEQAAAMARALIDPSSLEPWVEAVVDRRGPDSR
ncbi:MAG: M16 family metallopeptidase [Candidatus Polarisedimenticolia bacterium]